MAAGVLLVLAYISTTEASWVLKDVQNTVPDVKTPFSVEYLNKKKWLAENFTWYTPRSCIIDSPSNSFSEVVCLTEGKHPFGVLSQQNHSVLYEYKEVFVKPSHLCYSWTVDVKSLSSSTYLLNVYISPLMINSSMNSRKATNVFHMLGEVPLITVDRGIYVEKIEMYGSSFRQDEDVWETSVTYGDRDDSILVNVKSKFNTSWGMCLIRSVSRRINQANSYLGSSEVLQYLQMNKSNSVKGVFLEPIAQHNGFLISEEDVFIFQPDGGFKLLPITLQSGIMSHLLLLRHGFAAIIDGNVVVFNENGNKKLIEKDEADFTETFTCSSLVKGVIDTCNYLMLLSNNRNKGFVYVQNLHSWSTEKLQVPLCVSVESCFVEDIQVSAILETVRILLTLGHGSSQYFADYDLAEKRWSLTELVAQVHFTKMYYFPVLSHHMILVSAQALYRYTDRLQLWCSYDDVINHTVVSGSQVLMVFSTGYSIYLQVGCEEIYKVYLGEEILPLTIHNEFFMLQYYNRSHPRLEHLPLFQELVSVSGAQSASIVHFESNIHFEKKLYYLDKEDKIEVTAKLVGLLRHNIKVVHHIAIVVDVMKYEEKISDSDMHELSTVYSVKLNQSTKYRSHVTVVHLVPDLYRGFMASALQAHKMFISIGCPIDKRMKLSVTNPVSCDVINVGNFSIDLKTNETTCARLTILDTIDVRLQFFVGATRTHALYGNTSVQYLLGSAESLTILPPGNTSNEMSMKANRVDVLLLHVTLNSPQSFCTYHATMLLEVEDLSDGGRTLIVVLSIGLGFFFSCLLLTISFILFKKQTEKEHETEAELQKMQQELRQLASLRHYQDQIDVGPPSVGHGTEKRKSDIARRYSRQKLASMKPHVEDQADVIKSNNDAAAGIDDPIDSKCYVTDDIEDK